jgi:hypothetical protein
MCVVSAVHDWGQHQPIDIWTPQAVEAFEELVERAKEFDVKTGQPDCVDPAKAAFFTRIKARVAAKEAGTKLGLVGEQLEAFILGAEWASEPPPPATTTITLTGAVGNNTLTSRSTSEIRYK